MTQDVRRLREPRLSRNETPFCDADVLTQEPSSSWWIDRMSRSVAAGRRPKQCSRRADVEVDGKCYCNLHAGPVLIKKIAK